MVSKECVAMILAGGQGSRLGVLTKNVAKPAVPFGAKYRIIDFGLSNCIHSGIDTVGVLTQYQPLELNTYIGNGQPWDLDRNDGGVFVLPPYVNAEKGEWYKGTANAIYQNIGFVDQFNAEYVLILSGDHIYKMDYDKMLQEHKNSNAGATIAVIPVPWDEANRFGIMNTDEDGVINEFAEKPAKPKSNLASMGVYIFNWDLLKKHLMVDENNTKSSNDFGKNIIPAMLNAGEKLCAYRFEGYWKDVGTIQSLWQANMDLLEAKPAFNLYDNEWRIFSRNPVKPPHFTADTAKVTNTCVTEGCEIYGEVDHSILFEGVTIAEGAIVQDSIIMPNAVICKNSRIYKSIIGANTVVGENAEIGADVETDEYLSDICSDDITLLGQNIYIDKGVKIGKNCMLEKDISLETLDIGSKKQEDENKMIS